MHFNPNIHSNSSNKLPYDSTGHSEQSTVSATTKSSAKNIGTSILVKSNSLESETKQQASDNVTALDKPTDFAIGYNFNILKSGFYTEFDKDFEFLSKKSPPLDGQRFPLEVSKLALNRIYGIFFSFSKIGSASTQQVSFDRCLLCKIGKMNSVSYVQYELENSNTLWLKASENTDPKSGVGFETIYEEGENGLEAFAISYFKGKNIEMICSSDVQLSYEIWEMSGLRPKNKTIKVFSRSNGESNWFVTSKKINQNQKKEINKKVMKITLNPFASSFTPASASSIPLQIPGDLTNPSQLNQKNVSKEIPDKDIFNKKETEQKYKWSDIEVEDDGEEAPSVTKKEIVTLDNFPTSLIEHRIGYTFKDKKTLIESMTFNNTPNPMNLRRNAFLGDAILQVLTNELTSFCEPSIEHSHASLFLIQVINSQNKFLDLISNTFNLKHFLRTNQYTLKKDIYVNPSHSFYNDMTKALLGAIFTDSGIESVRPLFLKFFAERFKKGHSSEYSRNLDPSKIEFIESFKQKCIEYIERNSQSEEMDKLVSQLSSEVDNYLTSIGLSIEEWEKTIEAITGKFNNKNLLRAALADSSFCKEMKFSVTFPTFSFLGSSLISLLLAEYLIKSFPLLNNNELTNKRIKLLSVSFESILEKLKIKSYLLIGKDFPPSLQDNVNKIYKQCYANILAAIYLDKGYPAVREFFLNTFSQD